MFNGSKITSVLLAYISKYYYLCITIITITILTAMKVRQANGDAPRVNNYCTAREYEVFVLIAKNEMYKAGDTISGEVLKNKTVGKAWKITECDRRDGGKVSIIDTNGVQKTLVFVDGGRQTTGKTETAKTTETETSNNNNNNNNDNNNGNMATTNNNNSNDMMQIASLFANIQKEAYNNGYKTAEEESADKVAKLVAEIEAMKENGAGTVINITINGQTRQEKPEHVLNENIEDIVTCLAGGENVFLWGPAGAGKNVIAEDAAKILGVKFFYMNTVYTKYDIIGFTDANGNYVPTAFVNWLKNDDGGLYLADEICTNSPEANIAYNALLANGYIVLQNGEVLKKTDKHYFVAADNTNGLGATEEYNGRYKMDDSTRDRFAFFEVNYDAAVEKSLVGEKTDILEFIYDVRKVCAACHFSMTLGYRCIKALKEHYNEDAGKMLVRYILKGREHDTDFISELKRRATGTTKYHTALGNL